jgi:hypothetical protein
MYASPTARPKLTRDNGGYVRVQHDARAPAFAPSQVGGLHEYAEPCVWRTSGHAADRGA